VLLFSPHPSLFLTSQVAFSGLFTQIVWSFLWIFSLAVNYSVFQRVSNCRVEENDDGKSKVVCDNNSLYMVMVYLNFVMFWNSEVIKVPTDLPPLESTAFRNTVLTYFYLPLI